MADYNSGSSDSMFVDTSAKFQSIRALNRYGQPDQTICFTEPFLSRPYHHQLICGHIIQTRTVEKCGSNCKPANEAESKSKERPFSCPEQICVIQARRAPPSIFAVKSSSAKYRMETRPRPCKLGHVYGADEASDKQRRAENEARSSDAFGDLDLSRDDRKYRTRDEFRRFRNRSRSPVRGDKVLPAESSFVDEAENLNQQAKHDDSYRIAMSFSGPGIRRKKNGQFMTRAEMENETADAQVAKSLGKMQLPTSRKEHFERLQRVHAAEEEQKKFSREEQEEAARKRGKLMALPNEGIFLHAECGVCEQPLVNFRHRCRTCPQEPGFDLCETCFSTKSGCHVDGKHEFVRLDTSRLDAVADDSSHEDDDDNDDGFDEKAPGSVFDVNEKSEKCGRCNTLSTEYLVRCAHCGLLFHPGCHGTGCYEDYCYHEARSDREVCLRYDYRRSKEGKIFKCIDCNESHTEALKRFKAGVQQQREWRGQRREISKQRQEMARHYNAQQAIDKRIELRKAETDQEREVIEAKYEALARAQMEVDDDRGDGDAGAYGLFIDLPVRLKPGME